MFWPKAREVTTPLLTDQATPVPAQAMHCKNPRRSMPSLLWSLIISFDKSSPQWIRMSCSQEVILGSRAVYSPVLKNLQEYLPGRASRIQYRMAILATCPLEVAAIPSESPPRPTQSPASIHACSKSKKVRAQHLCRARRKEEVKTDWTYFSVPARPAPGRGVPPCSDRTRPSTSSPRRSSGGSDNLARSLP